eukprot:Gb_30416 [translate_table: standard]
MDESRVARRRRMEIRRFKFVADGVTVLESRGKRSRVVDATLTCYLKNGVDQNSCKRRFRVACNKINNNSDGSNPEGGDLKPNFDGSKTGRSINGAPEDEKDPKKQKILNPQTREQCPPHGCVSVCGRRREMEDAISVLPAFVDFLDRKFHFFGVFDGHGGSQAAFLCRDRLHQLLAAEVNCFASQKNSGLDDGEQWQKIMGSCFQKMDAEVGGLCCRNDEKVPVEATVIKAPETVGSTAVVAVVSSTEIVVANCGDSRAVLSRGGKAIPLSVDHKPDHPEEMGRIEAAGGRVIFWNGYRVLGVLATSRSIGDRYLKPYVIAEPEITVSRRADDDECLILASDGLWDVLSNEIVCEIARKCLAGRRLKNSSKHGKDAASEETPAGMAAALLTKLALARGSSDNISVVVVDLRSVGRPTSDS